MNERVLNDQQEDGSWHFREPVWDEHACFDALFILRYLPIRMLRELSKRTEKQRAGYCHVAGMAVVSPISLTGQNPLWTSSIFRLVDWLVPVI
jgi:hypothetical protein